ncbi:MAG TPA: DUF2889 domain-containing protein [Lachnospiraceae bacterium]|nr:DUF2889 domain-containing protein [Lachnospiraceae bacterium]
MEKVTSRNFTVDYFEKEDTIWLVRTHLMDEVHEIEAEIEIDMTEMVVTDARIIFRSFPIEHCSLIESNAKKLIGIKIDSEFSRNVMKIFMGPQGCPNIMTLLNISVPGIIYFYYPHRLKTGKMLPAEWDHMIRTELKEACLAHTLLA